MQATALKHKSHQQDLTDHITRNSSFRLEPQQAIKCKGTDNQTHSNQRIQNIHKYTQTSPNTSKLAYVRKRHKNS